jgi:large subunit ribosomal protein L29
MKTKELRELSQDKLITELKEAHKEIFNMRMQRAGGQMTKNHLFKEVRQRIARINTLLTEKVK